LSIERSHKSLKGECIRPGTPLSLEDARRLVEAYVEHFNNVHLNSAIGYIAPKDMVAGHQQEIQDAVTGNLKSLQKHFSGNATSMIGLCQEGKSSPDALRRSASVNSFWSFAALFWPGK
jgi:hypothetical protein